MTPDPKDKELAEAYEALAKDIGINGVTGFTDSIFTAADYEPTTTPGVAATLPRDCNRGTGLAMLNLLRTKPMRLATFNVGDLPTASDWPGCLVFVPDASGSSIVAFSDGSNWRRVDTGATVT